MDLCACIESAVVAARVCVFCFECMDCRKTEKSNSFFSFPKAAFAVAATAALLLLEHECAKSLLYALLPLCMRDALTIRILSTQQPRIHSHTRLL